MKNIILLAAFWVVCASFAFGAEKNAPTTRTGIEAIEGDVSAARKDLEAARAAARSAWEKSPVRAASETDLASKREALEKARQSGTAKEKLDASAAYNAARLSAEGKAKAATDTPDIRKAEASLAVAEGKLAAANAETARRDEAERAAKVDAENAKVDANPILRAIKNGKLVRGMSYDEANKAMGGRLAGGQKLKSDDAGDLYEVQLSNKRNFLDNSVDPEGPGIYSLYLTFRDGKLTRMRRGPTDISRQLVE